MSRRTNRREFLRQSAAVGAGFWVAGCSQPLGTVRRLGPNEQLNVAVIGAGGRGHSDTKYTAKAGARIAALCDVDEKRAAKTRREFPDATFFHDFRVMFDKMARDFDAVIISTPDHTHAVATMMAMKHGKHVYTQKPLTHDIAEARALAKAAKKYGVVSQMGNQGTSWNDFRTGVEIVQSGVIGAVRGIHVWTNRPVWPQGIVAPAETMPIPGTLKWDLWLGTAPERPYHEAYLPFKWRGWVDYGTGALGDMACHTLNLPYMACRLGHPTHIEAKTSEFNGECYPNWSVIDFQFPARGDLPPVTLHWYDGGESRPTWIDEKLASLLPGQKIDKCGSVMVGDKGSLYSPGSYGGNLHLLPEKDFEGFEPPAPRLPRVNSKHYAEWVQACRQGRPEMCMSNFDYAGPLTETVLLGCVAIRAGKPIEWDASAMRVTNDTAANRYLQREYREGWTL